MSETELRYNGQVQSEITTRLKRLYKSQII